MKSPLEKKKCFKMDTSKNYSPWLDYDYLWVVCIINLLKLMIQLIINQ